MKKKGFTLLEVMIALLLLMVGIVFLIDLFPLAIKNFQKSKDMTSAVFLAQSKIEEIRNLPTDEQAASCGQSVDPKYPDFICKTSSTLWPVNSNYNELRVQVYKKEKGIIGKAYADVSTLSGSPRMNSFASTVIFPVDNPTIFYGLLLATDSRKVYWTIGDVNVEEQGARNVPKRWQELPMPAGREIVPDKISVNACDIRLLYIFAPELKIPGPDLRRDRTMLSTYIYVFLTDKKNKCVWASSFWLRQDNPSDIDSIRFEQVKAWYQIKNSLPI